MSPFDLKAAISAKHAQHVVLIHFPIALSITGFAFDVLARWKQNRALLSAAYYNLIAAAITSVPAVATGLLAWQWLFAGKRLHGNLRLHLLLALSSSTLIWLACWLHVRDRRKLPQDVPGYRLALELATVAVIAFTGHVGGILSGVNVPGN
jgi:uncharacterized membrane protein